jgi:hypothetical protein
MLENGTGAELGVEVEAVAVTENWVKRVSEARGLTLTGFRDLLGGAGFAEARMSAALLGCMLEGRQYAMNIDRPGKFGMHRTGLFREG